MNHTNEGWKMDCFFDKEEKERCQVSNKKAKIVVGGICSEE